jgi:hypothetical protein
VEKVYEGVPTSLGKGLTAEARPHVPTPAIAQPAFEVTSRRCTVSEGLVLAIGFGPLWRRRMILSAGVVRAHGRAEGEVMRLDL